MIQEYQGKLTGKQIDALPSDMNKLEVTINEVRSQADGFPALIDQSLERAKMDAAQEYDARATSIIQKLEEYRLRLAAL